MLTLNASLYKATYLHLMLLLPAWVYSVLVLISLSTQSVIYIHQPTSLFRSTNFSIDLKLKHHLYITSWKAKVLKEEKRRRIKTAVKKKQKYSLFLYCSGE